MTGNGFAFRIAESGELPQLMRMWTDCFHDSPETVGNIFANLQKPENIFVLADKNGPAAMLSILEFSLTSPANACKSAYIYGVATSPPEQGKGLGGTLLKETGALLAHRGFACAVLVPANTGLFDYYGKRGYNTAFRLNRASVSAAEIGAGKTFPLEKIDSGRLAAIRGASLGDSRMFACWDAAYLKFVVQESEFYGGGTYAVNIDGNEVCAVCHRDGGTVYIKELAAAQHTVEPALRSIHAHFGADAYALYLREDFTVSRTNHLLPFAMIQWYDNKMEAEMAASGGAPAYIAHVLD